MTQARRCGDCQLCCRLLPTKEIDKPASTRCPHQRHGIGCAIYDTRPLSCRLWSCAWLSGEDVGERPDRSRLVVDSLPDYVVQDGRRLPVVQVWCAAADRNAHRNPAFRAWLARQGKASLVRFDNKEAVVVVPPSCSADGKWAEIVSCMSEAEHTVEDKLAAGLTFDIPIAAIERKA